MKIAVEGCAHGELEKIYECIETLQAREGIKLDLLICCGDFQSVRNRDDLRAMAVPEKYQNMQTFYKYYSGEKLAPILTIFIGGNHEASNYLQELPYGGWVAPNIYYMGRASVVNFGNLRIGGLSGIFKGQDYLQGLWECPPYTPSSLRSVYHVRALDVFRLSQVKEQVNIMLSHDWPTGITDYGDKNFLLKRKPYFREDIASKQLGSPPCEKLLHTIKPDYWFSAHLHCQFVALVPHEEDGKETKFLALDKCLPRRKHLQILDIPDEYNGDMCLKHDAEWLAILKHTNHLLSVKNVECHLPGPGGSERFDYIPTNADKDAVKSLMGDLTIRGDSFVQTAPIFKQGIPKSGNLQPISNPQTLRICEKLCIDDPLQVVMARAGREMSKPYSNSEIVNVIPVTNTPVKCSKLSLPAPITPSEIDSQNLLQKSIQSSPDNKSFLSDTSCNTSDCVTPVSVGPKKTFKRRNVEMYTPDADDSGSTQTSSLNDSDSPRSSKVPYVRSNVL